MPRFAEGKSSNHELNRLQEKVLEKIKETEKLTSISKPEDPHQIVPQSTYRHRYNDEHPVAIRDAWSNSVYYMEVGKHIHCYPALNAVRSWSYWLSKGVHQKIDEIIWEAHLYRLTRVHAINLIWAYAPAKFKIQYSNDNIKYYDLVNWKSTVDKKEGGWWARLIPAYRHRYRSFPDRITFEQPVWARKFRIIMKDAVNGFIGLYRVEFMVRNWIVLLKNTPKDSCKESCWTLNTVIPKAGTQVQCILKDLFRC